jgi:hypothetical protein
MKTILLLSSLAISLATVTSSFAQSVNRMPTRAYDAQGYIEETPTPVWEHQEHPEHFNQGRTEHR